MKSVIRGAGYVLAHTPDMVLHNGTTQTTERIVNPDSEYLKELPSHIRSFEQAVAYWPNQVYIGNKTPDELAAVAQPWCDKECDCHERYGKFGQMMPQNEFLLLMQACDVFDLVELEAEFVAANREALAANPVMEQSVLDRLKNGNSLEEIQRLVEEEGAEGLYHLGQLVGCVKRAHDIDANLSAHVMHENLVSKASSVLALLNVIHVTGIDRNQVEYVIDCAEEACGDINQRGGGNFAKSAAEIAGLNNASGSDCRAFCAAPAHAMIEAAALVASGAYHTVVVTAGGCTAKLGMNGKDHVKKGLPALEDMIGGFAVVITQDDGVNPFINLNMLGPPQRGHRFCPAGRHHLSGHRSAGSQRPEDHRYRQVFPGDAEPRHHQARRCRRCAAGQLQDDRCSGREAGRAAAGRAGQLHCGAWSHRLCPHPGPYSLRRSLCGLCTGGIAGRRYQACHGHW